MRITAFSLFLFFMFGAVGSGIAHHAVSTSGAEDVSVVLKTDPLKLEAGTTSTLTFSISDRQGKPVEGLSLHHDRLLHVVIAGGDFSVFAHVHPEDFGPITPAMIDSAGYPVRFTFPKAGRYMIGVDFSVKEQPHSKYFVIEVAGKPELGPLKQDLSRGKRVGDLDVALSSPGRISHGKEVTLTYLFRKDGKDVTDLEPYLSAPMHLAIISADLGHFMHTHGELPGMAMGGMHEHHMHMSVPGKFGPAIEVHAVFPSRGLYQIFGQVQRDGKVILTSFMVQVE